MTELVQNTYDQFAEEYANQIAAWGKGSFSFYYDLVLPKLLHFVGEVADLKLLDAGCGEGYFARHLASQGGQVTAIDVSPRLIELAQVQGSDSTINYRVHDLSQPLPEYETFFDIVVSNLVLNDVYDYQGYIATLGAVLNPGGRLILSMNNPYSAVIRDKVNNYFDTGVASLYEGLSKSGIEVYYFHRTLEEYISAFRDAGLFLKNLSDVQVTREMLLLDDEMPKKYHHFPYFMILELEKPVRPTQ